MEKERSRESHASAPGTSGRPCLGRTQARESHVASRLPVRARDSMGTRGRPHARAMSTTFPVSLSRISRPSTVTFITPDQGAGSRTVGPDWRRIEITQFVFRQNADSGIDIALMCEGIEQPKNER